ncbi:nucleotidyl transferase AbiEii/AbiGii toxin family protein [Caballeronia sp. BR00000012568055]|uniref:nucleotidyl transferase AbiEii/AbiGii toxin family protein n=1 Tax=Caballeronia sp. BR00000012568055 TaxID=2918761 RepID=UPI0023F8146D|nr:nucleotidyl transferase AbiEii/AbiGii toxin family protein [Caballeronia sp. BR00000012568055]
MTDTSPAIPHKIPADRPVDPLTIALLRDVKDACASVGAGFVLAGATARDMLMWHLHGLKSSVATRDVDIAICAISWPFHDALIDTLVQTQRFRRHPKQQQKLLFKPRADAYESELDIVPFGPIEAPAGEIRWPPDGDIVMTVLGFQEAVDTAQPIDIGEGLEVPVVTLPAFVLLKLFAWMDRRLKKNTDATDLLFVLRNYFDAGNAERTYAHAIDLLEAANFDVTLAAAGLLGREIRDLAYPATYAALRELLQTPKTYETLRQDFQARAAMQLGGFIDDSDALLAAFVRELF